MLRPETRLFIDRTAEIMRQFADTVTGDDLLLVTEIEALWANAGSNQGKSFWDYSWRSWPNEDRPTRHDPN